MCVTCVVGRADAGVVVDAIDAGGVVLTVVVFTVVGVYLTARTLEARWTHTATHTHAHTTCGYIIEDISPAVKHKI